MSLIIPPKNLPAAIYRAVTANSMQKNKGASKGWPGGLVRAVPPVPLPNETGCKVARYLQRGIA